MKEYPIFLNQALAIQKLIHEDAIDKINKEAEARSQAYRDKSLDTTVDIKQQAMAPYWASQEGPNDKWKIPLSQANNQIDIVTKQIADLDKMSIDYEEDLKRLNTELANYKKAAVYYESELHKGELVEYETAARLKMKQNKFMTDLDQQMLDDIGKIFAKELADFDALTKGDPAFWNKNKIDATEAFAKPNGTGNLEGMGHVALNQIQGTEVGSMLAAASTNIANPLAMMAEAAAKFLMSIENVQKVLNPFATILEGARAILEPLINNALQPLVDYLMQLGEVIGQVLSPFINAVAISLKILYGVLAITVIPVMQMVGAAFAWFNDKVIVPVGNGIIDIINGVINAINTVLGFLRVHIKTLDHILTTTEAAMEAKNLKLATEALGQTISLLEKRLNAGIDSQIQSWKDLYEVGAMSATEYASKSSAANALRPENSKNMVTIADQSLSTSTDILKRLTELNAIQTKINGNDLTNAQKLNMLTNAGLATSLQPVLENPPKVTIGDTNVAAPIVNTNLTTTVNVTQINALLAQVTSMQSDIDKLKKQVADMAVAPTVATATTVTSTGSTNYGGHRGYNDNNGMAVGTGFVPDDMVANIHKGEGVIPATFMDSIRKGDLSLSGGGNGGGSVNVVVNVNGSVTTENDLATSIAKSIFMLRKRGIVTV